MPGFCWLDEHMEILVLPLPERSVMPDLAGYLKGVVKVYDEPVPVFIRERSWQVYGSRNADGVNGLPGVAEEARRSELSR